MSHPLSDLSVSASLEMMDVEDGNRQDEDFLNPFMDAATGAAPITTTWSLEDQLLAEEEEGRRLLDPFLDAAADLEEDGRRYNDKDLAATTYRFTAARPRTASEPIANPLLTPESDFLSPAIHHHYHPSHSIDDVTTPTPLPPPSRSLSRRRGNVGAAASSTASSIRAPSVASISTTTSTASSSLRSSGHWTSNNNRESSSNARDRIVEEESRREGNGVRASLDSGMAAVRRWIRSRSSFTTPNNDNSNIASRRSTMPWSVEIASRHSDDENDLVSFGASRSTEDVIEPDDATTPTAHQQQQQRPTNRTDSRVAPPTIVEDRETPSRHPLSARQRALSEPDAAVRDFLFQRALTPHRGFRRLRYSGGTPTSGDYQQQQQPRSFWGPRTSDSNVGTRSTVPGAGIGPGTPGPSQLSSSAVEVLYSTSPEAAESGELSTVEPSVQEDPFGNVQSSSSVDNNSVVDSDVDPQREARARWILINRRFQVVITIVALIFSLLLFGILVCWVVLTSAYVVSIDKSCDVPLKAYFWLATLQLILDVFRTDIMRCIFRWDANSNQRIPCRVITYNAAYLMYAFMVLRMGIRSVFLNRDATCRTTAPELFQSSTAFVSLSIAAWSTIVLGYLLPFCIVATLLTLNGYTPVSDNQRGGAAGPVFPTPMGAPPGCVDQLRKVRLEDLTSESARECCICMEHFTARDTIVETECLHRYHMQCLADWLRQARTCPVCRMDVVPTTVRQTDGNNEDSQDVAVQQQTTNTAESAQNQHRLSLGPATRTFGRNTDIHHEVVSLFQIIRRSELRNRQSSSGSTELRNRSGSIEIRNRSMSQHDI